MNKLATLGADLRRIRIAKLEADLAMTLRKTSTQVKVVERQQKRDALAARLTQLGSINTDSMDPIDAAVVEAERQRVRSLISATDRVIAALIGTDEKSTLAADAQSHPPAKASIVAKAQRARDIVAAELTSLDSICNDSGGEIVPGSPIEARRHLLRSRISRADTAIAELTAKTTPSPHDLMKVAQSTPLRKL